MPAKFDLYDGAYERYGSDVYQQIRLETYGEDLGQTSWVSAEESDRIPVVLELTPECRVLEIGSGSGRYALRVAEKVGCQIVGLDANPHGICNANDLARIGKQSSTVQFIQSDASKELSFEDESFDAAFANDVLCHLPNRRGVFAELYRVLKPGGRLLFSDCLVIGGVVSHEEIATRSSIGYYTFSPPGENERLLQSVGFNRLELTDTTPNAAAISRRWHDAREKRKDELVQAEGQSLFSGLQEFLLCVYRLTHEKRLLRYVYLARKDV
jgi:ubiquinone/menaquinone biosynthesis C-methylase UbiE